MKDAKGIASDDSANSEAPRSWKPTNPSRPREVDNKSDPLSRGIEKLGKSVVWAPNGGRSRRGARVDDHQSSSMGRRALTKLKDNIKDEK